VVRGLLIAAVLALDGGTNAPPPDGGVALAPRPAPPAESAETERLRAELQTLQARIATLEKDVAVARQQNEQLQAVVRNLESLRDELQAAVDERARNEQAAAQQAAQARAAVNGLMGAVQQLQTGDTDIGAALGAARSASLSPLVHQDIEQAQRSLDNEDLGVAASYLLQAITDAQTAR